MLFHTDAVQGVGKVPSTSRRRSVDLVSLSAHKMYGPKGVGALYVRRKPRVRIAAQIDGGGHERGMRSGTLNVPAIVGFGKAAELARTRWPAEAARLLALRERLREGLQSQARHAVVNGSLEHRLPGNLNISFAFVEGEAMMMAIKDVAVSSGSACTSASLEPCYVLRALASTRSWRTRSIRFGLGPLQHRGRGRLRGRPGRRQGQAAARDVAALRDGTRKASTSSRIAVGSALRRGHGTVMAYSDKVIDHYENPRNVGTLDKEDPNVGTGLVGAPACGDVMRLQIKVNDDGIIEDAKFKTFGCGSAIASSSLVTEWVKGKTLDEAMTIKNTQIVEELNLPPVKIHCSVLAEDAIKSAIADYKTKRADGNGHVKACRPRSQRKGRTGRNRRWPSRRHRAERVAEIKKAAGAARRRTPEAGCASASAAAAARASPTCSSGRTGAARRRTRC